MMVQLDWESMSKEETLFVNYLIRASVCDIVRSNEIDKFVEEVF